MIDFIKWSFLVILIGWIIFPITFHFFKKSTDRGFSISKILGLLIWGYLFWLGNIFGIITNSPLSAVFILFIIILISYYFFYKNQPEIFAWIKANTSVVLFYEICFLIAFLSWSIIRAANPEIIGTEKPMELAFINSIYQSPIFPPSDPWLSGYSISYYYFGYVLVAMLMHFLGTNAGVAFNLFIALMFSLIAVSSSGVLFNIISNVQGKGEARNTNHPTRRKLLSISILAPLFILLVSNGAGLMEMMHSRGIFWEFAEDGQAYSTFWEWLDIQELSESPSAPYDWIPSRAGGTWWWRSSRVLQDYTLDGQTREIIDEFPFFSFLLADLHPHLISLPFVMMNIYLCFYLFLHRNGRYVFSDSLKESVLEPFFWLTCFILGSLIFINTWDFPIYFLLASACIFIPAFQQDGKIWANLKKLIVFFVALALACIMLFLPFIWSLSSQASGLIPSLIFRTRGVHYLVMFLPHIALTILFCIQFQKRYTYKKIVSNFFIVMLGLITLFSLSILYIFLLDLSPRLLISAGNIFQTGIDQSGLTLNLPLLNLLRIYGAQSSNELISAAIKSLIHKPWVILLSAAFISFSWAALDRKDYEKVEEYQENTPIANHFILILLILVAALSVFPELFYLRDQFGWRMNTIFKFYFQVWILFSFVSAYAIYELCQLRDNTWRKIWIWVSGLIIMISLIYPVFAIRDKTNAFRDIKLTLDGNKFLELYQPSDFEAVQYLLTVPYGVVSEAVGGSYSSYGRISRLTGYPTVLGWPGHEVQWRGGMDEIGSRELDIETLYTTVDWNQAADIIQEYDIKYILIGDLEKRTYAVNEDKFKKNMVTIFKNSEVAIYSFNQR